VTHSAHQVKAFEPQDVIKANRACLSHGAWSTRRKVANLPAGNARGLKESPILFARIERIGRCTDCDVGHQGTLIAPSIKTIRPDPNGHIEIKPDRQAGITRMLAAVTELVIGEPLHELLHETT
jgi:hypothetical protein